MTDTNPFPPQLPSSNSGDLNGAVRTMTYMWPDRAICVPTASLDAAARAIALAVEDDPDRPYRELARLALRAAGVEVLP